MADRADASGGSYFGKMKLGTVLVILAASPVAAASGPVTLSCVFDTECFETEGCADSAYTMTIDWDGRTWRDVGADHSAPAQPARVTTDAETFNMLVDLRNDVLAFGRATDAGDWWTLTVHEEVARLSVHMPASGLALYYKGTCEGAPS